MNLDLPGPSRGNPRANTSRRSEEYSSDDEFDPGDNMALDELEYDSDESDVAAPNYEENPPEWQPVNAVGMGDIPFTKEEGFLVAIPEVTPIAFFMLLLDNIFLENIVRATNRYALELFCGPSTEPQSRIHKWKDITVDDLKVFIGIILHMGIIRMPHLEDYWKTNQLFISRFPNFMPRDKFLLILRCINFKLNPDPNNRSSKVQFLIDYFNNKMASVYYPQKRLCIDEEMVLWRGRLHFRQYIKGKRHKYGIKMYSLCDPHGLIIKFFMYCGVLDDLGGNGHAANVVLKLMQGKLDCGHSLFMDNFYNSFPLASLLLRRDTYCTGTIRADRKYLLQEVISAKLKKGETIARYAESVCVGKWKDKQVVNYISTEYPNDMVTSLNRVNLEREKPMPMVAYNHFMKGVDRSDQMMSYYSCDRKTLRWYEKIFIHIIQMITNNAHYLFNEVRMSTGEKKMKLYDFQLSVIGSLVPALPEPERPLKRKSIPHVPSKIEQKRKGRTSIQQKRCRVCKRDDNKERRTSWHCLECHQDYVNQDYVFQPVLTNTTSK